MAQSDVDAVCEWTWKHVEHNEITWAWVERRDRTRTRVPPEGISLRDFAGFAVATNARLLPDGSVTSSRDDVLVHNPRNMRFEGLNCIAPNKYEARIFNKRAFIVGELPAIRRADGTTGHDFEGAVEPSETSQMPHGPRVLYLYQRTQYECRICMSFDIQEGVRPPCCLGKTVEPPPEDPDALRKPIVCRECVNQFAHSGEPKTAPPVTFECPYCRTPCKAPTLVRRCL